MNAANRKVQRGDALPRSPRGNSTRSSLRTEGKLRRVDNHRGKGCFAAAGNAVNPRIGSQVQYPDSAVEEKAVEGLRKPRDGTR